MYMHVLGHGDPVKLAASLHAALAESKTPLSTGPAGPATAPPPIDLDTAAIDQALSAKGANNGGVYQFGIPRAEPIKDAGMAVPPAMGSANAIKPSPLSGIGMASSSRISAFLSWRSAPAAIGIKAVAMSGNTASGCSALASASVERHGLRRLRW